ncbi:MAG: hypothetical protein FJY07_06435 [Bacteroidetes bacterium]|nr:hypothetical protein [Bacteroidota bacterium]
MKAVEFKTRIKNHRILIPSEMQSRLETEKDVRVIVLIDEPDAYDDLTFQQTAQEQFLKGYSDSDSVYDNN